MKCYIKKFHCSRIREEALLATVSQLRQRKQKAVLRCQFQDGKNDKRSISFSWIGAGKSFISSPSSGLERKGNCETSKLTGDTELFMGSQILCPWQGTIEESQGCGRLASV